MKIPILNIYYLLCYAWNKLEEGNKVEISGSDYNQLVELIGRVLVNGCNHIFKQGLDRDYVEVNTEYSGIKGKVNFSDSINKNLFKQGKSVCIYDEFEYNVLQNQILKATLLRLTKIKNLDKKLYSDFWSTYLKFDRIDDIPLQLNHFSKVRIHRNNSFYDFLLNICRLIIESTVLNESDGTYLFKEFVGTEKAMATMFESFVRNFYKKEQNEYRVSSPKIFWQAEAIGHSNLEYLPDMRTDIVLESNTRKIIIDTKYYQDTTSGFYGSEKFHSNNLYQVYAYLRNIEEVGENELNLNSEGLLLYPTIEENYDQSYLIGGHKVRIATINLAEEWRDISNRLLFLIQ